jgi:hypothetical protein
MEPASLAIDANDKEDLVLSVGNHTFQTTRSTLRMAGPGSFLHTLVTADAKYLPTRRNSQGHLLIDRDGTHFEYILSSLRQGPLHPPLVSSHEDFLYHERGLWRLVASLEAEAQFYTLRGWPLVYLLGHPRIVQSSHKLSYEPLSPTSTHEQCWKVTVETNVDEDEMHWLCFWVPNLTSFEIELSVSRKRSTLNSGHALLEGWGIDLQTSVLPMSESTGALALVPSACAPWRPPLIAGPETTASLWWCPRSTDVLHLDTELPHEYFDNDHYDVETHCISVLSKRPPTAKMPDVPEYSKDGNNVYKFLDKYHPHEFDRLELWPEAPMLWVPWNGHSYGISCCPLAEAVSAGMRLVWNIDNVGFTPRDPSRSESFHWVSSNPREWNVCFLDPHAPEGQEGLVQKCPPQPRQTLALRMSESVFSYELISGQPVSCHCKALSSRHGQVHLRFSLQEPRMAKAVLLVKLRGHAE